MRRWPLVIVAVLLGRRRRAGRDEPAEEPPGLVERPGSIEPRPAAELAVAALLLGGAASAIAFVVVYATDGIADQTQWLGLALGVALLLVAAAFALGARTLVPDDEAEEAYPVPDAEAVAEVRAVVAHSASRITRKQLLAGAGGVAAASVGAALVVPGASLGPLLDTSELRASVWRRGTRLVDERDRPYTSTDIEAGSFYTAYPEGADHDRIDAPVVVVRLAPSALRLPRSRASWAPQGLLAFSKICTHAGCAVSEYRKPLFAPTEPRPALVCPCHYSTFDPATGGDVIFGPAGRPLPQLPLLVDAATGELRAAGQFSGPVGPSWSGVRE
jgi:ubiquinol-cytochrome c reductase iron-sulfur subunit